jgi:hypothetical protein
MNRAFTRFALRPWTGTTTHRLDYLPASPLCYLLKESTDTLHTTSPKAHSALGANFVRVRFGRSFAGTGISTRCPSTTPVGLRSRLTLGGLAWPRNPWSFGGGVSHSPFATHACILTRVASTTRSPCRFARHTTLPYPSTRLAVHARCTTSEYVNAIASAVCLSPVTLSARNHLTSELLRTL